MSEFTTRHEHLESLVLGERVADALWFENGPDYLRFGAIVLRCARGGIV